MTGVAEAGQRTAFPQRICVRFSTSSINIVTAFCWGPERLAGVGLKSRRFTVSLPSITRSSRIGTVKVWLVTLLPNRRVPLTGT